MLDTTPRDLFHWKERKALEDRIAGIGRQIDLTRTQLEAIPKQHGYGDVKSAEAAYKTAKAKLESVKKTLGETGKEAVVKSTSAKAQQQKVSMLKELAARRLEVQQRSRERQKTGKEKNGVEEER